jgi:3-methyl-2-oxobutanoate hydroxymethyltransferase
VQGREAAAAEQMLADAQALEAAGAIGLVLETIPATLAARITAAITIPTIGIGAGPDCDGQVQVWHDLLGLFPGKMFRHAKRYAELGEAAEAALRSYTDEVRQGAFPTKEQSL